MCLYGVTLTPSHPKTKFCVLFFEGMWEPLPEKKYSHHICTVLGRCNCAAIVL